MYITPNAFFSANNLAPDAYSGHSGVRSAPSPKGVPPPRQISSYACGIIDSGPARKEWPQGSTDRRHLGTNVSWSIPARRGGINRAARRFNLLDVVHARWSWPHVRRPSTSKKQSTESGQHSHGDPRRLIAELRQLGLSAELGGNRHSVEIYPGTHTHTHTHTRRGGVLWSTVLQIYGLWARASPAHRPTTS